MCPTPNPHLPVRVAPVSASELVVHGLRTLLEPFRGTVDVDDRRPDIVLLDTSGRGEAGITDLVRVRRSVPDTAVLVLTDLDDERALLRALRTGAQGYVRSPRPTDGLVQDLLRVAAGELVVDGDLAVRATALAARLLDLDRSPAELLGLTEREVEVLSRLEDGATAREIGVELFVSHETIRSHLKRIYRKLGVHDRPSAVRRARQEGILSDPGGNGTGSAVHADGGGDVARTAVRSPSS